MACLLLIPHQNSHSAFLYGNIRIQGMKTTMLVAASLIPLIWFLLLFLKDLALGNSSRRRP